MKNDGAPPRAPRDGVIFTSDIQRAHAADVRRLLIRVENGVGEDRALGADILEITGAPAMIGDPIGCIDCALYLVEFLEQDRLIAIERVSKNLAGRVRAGWKTTDAISISDVARAICALALKVYLGRMERAPA